MKGVHPWLVCWTPRADTRYFCSALVATLVVQVLNIYFSAPHTVSLQLFTSAAASWAGSRAESPVSKCVSLVRGILLGEEEEERG
jgi:hypothetical protein